MEPRIHNVDHVPLDRHGVLEASAGTGKTYTLERLVLRLLKEAGVALEEILLVTYTEKATGELRGRLRRTLANELAAAPAQRDILQRALDQFDQAPIFTIHGACQKILQEHAFEHGHDFRPRLVDDRELTHRCLREVQRKHWPAEYGDRLRAVLELSGYDAKWEQTVRDLAQRVRLDCDHRLLPEPADDWLKSVPDLDVQIRDAHAELKRLLGPLDAATVSAHPLLRAFAKVDTTRIHDERRRLVLLPVMRWLEDPGADTCPAVAFQRLLQRCGKHKEFGKGGFRVLDGKAKRARLRKLAGPLLDMLDVLEALRAAATAAVPPYQLTVRTVLQLQHCLDDEKRQRGLMSFEDMLTRMARGLDPKHNPRADSLAAGLRRRFRYAIVDEFQDTDPLQWRILRCLFVEGGDSRLFVVGDPKQAIYTFRGADFQTYRSAVAELEQAHRASVCSLDTNWRSSAELVQGLNHLFERGEWFVGQLEFSPVKPADEHHRSAFVTPDPDRAALTLVRLREDDSYSKARRRFARFCADEIRRLLEASPIIKKKGETRSLQPDDICLLLRARGEAGGLVEELGQAGIPFTFYKKTGLWQSDEARHIGWLLSALAKPEDRRSLTRALLTRFVHASAAELAQCEDLPPRHAARLLFQDWAELAEGQKWARLFDAMLYQSGILQRELRERHDAERRFANYRHILQSLEQAAYGRGLDLFGLIDLLETWKTSRDDENADYEPIETQRPKVKILTIHAAKGLEFPIVFLAGGFTDGSKDRVTTYRDAERRVVFDLAPDNAAVAKSAEEREAETRRLYYVALTRAMVRVYVPWLELTKRGTPGPLRTLIAPALAKSGVDELGSPIARCVECPARRPRGYVAKAPPQNAAAITRLDDPTLLFPRLDADLAQRRIVLRSFSSLHRKLLLRAAEGASFGERAQRADDDVPEALADADALRGPVFGDMVHAVLEGVDFAAVGRAATPEALLTPGGPLDTLLHEQLARNLPRLRTRARGVDLAELCRAQITGLVWKALHTPLADLGGPLWQVSPHDRLHELEFHFPEATEQPPPPETQHEEGFLTGIMDLVVRRGERVFLVDWKTNYLTGYTPADVAQAMADCDYVRQYRLYLQALARWIGRVRGKAFSFERDFGGVYYLFLRGLNGRDESTGVYFQQPKAEDLRLDLVLAEQ